MNTGSNSQRLGAKQLQDELASACDRFVRADPPCKDYQIGTDSSSHGTQSTFSRPGEKEKVS